MALSGDVTHTEWAAWRSLCHELNTANGIQINEEPKLAAAIKRWGEELHQLRLAKPEFDQTALDNARAAYPDLVV